MCDGYATLDLFATWEPGDDVLSGALTGLRLDARIDNVTDEDYERSFEGVGEPGRSFKFTLAYTLAFGNKPIVILRARLPPND